MASRVTDWGCGALLSILLGHLPPPEELFVALCEQEPGAATDGDAIAAFEPAAAAGYARVAIPTGPAHWSDPTDNAFSSVLAPVDFGVPDDDWGEVSHYALCTAATGGEVYCYGEFDVPAVITATFVVVIPGGSLRLQVSSLEALVVVG